MFPYSIWILLGLVVVLSSLQSYRQEGVLPNGGVYVEYKNPAIWSLIVILILTYFAGNTIANDVFSYRQSFVSLDTNLSWSELYENGIGGNPLFEYIQLMFKRFISDEPGSFHLFVGLIVQTCIVLYYRRYSPSLPMSLCMFITSGLFYFTMVSWKQSMAMAIGLAGIPLLQRDKVIWYIAFLGVLMLIHPYIIVYGMLPLLASDTVWTKRNAMILVVMIIAAFSLSKILEPVLEVTEVVFGDKHDAQWFTSDHGVSLPRILFFSITPILSIIYRKRIDGLSYPLMNGFIQMSVISFGFMLMSMSGGANFISRMGTYFEPFTYAALPFILLNIVPEQNRKFMKFIILGMFLVFFCFLQLKRGSIF